MLNLRTTLPQFVNAAAWAALLTWPWQAMFHGLVALAVVHLVMPFWAAWLHPDVALHRKFALGPLAMFVIDAIFLTAAWRRDLWSDLTAVFVPILALSAIVALAVAAAIMTVLARTRDKPRG